MLSANMHLDLFCCLQHPQDQNTCSSFLLIAVIDNKIQTHTTLFFLSSKLSVKAVQHSSQTAKLCSHCTIAARSCQLSQLGGRLFTQTNAC